MKRQGHWQYTEKPPREPFGFVYLITNLINGRKYIGKKQCIAIRTMRPLKGKTRRRRKEVETRWRTYTGSSKELNADIKAHGKSEFKFEILRWCCSKSEMAYYEAKAQFDADVLLRDDYYNGIINIRLGRIKLS